jgi:CheY-like chemotaxis protein
VQTLAQELRFDLLLLDNTMSGHWGKDMMKALGSRGLLLDTPVILVVESRNPMSEAVAETLGALHVHERREGYGALSPVVHWLLLERGY